jgi:hypothetical protein
MNRGSHWQHKPYLPGVFFLFIMLMIFTKGWFVWALFCIVPWIFFSRMGGSQHRSWSWCESGEDEAENIGKRKNDETFSDEKRKREGRYIQTPDGEWIEVI